MTGELRILCKKAKNKLPRLGTEAVFRSHSKLVCEPLFRRCRGTEKKKMRTFSIVEIVRFVSSSYERRIFVREQAIYVAPQHNGSNGLARTGDVLRKPVCFEYLCASKAEERTC